MIKNDDKKVLNGNLLRLSCILAMGVVARSKKASKILATQNYHYLKHIKYIKIRFFIHFIKCGIKQIWQKFLRKNHKNSPA